MYIVTKALLQTDYGLGTIASSKSIDKEFILIEAPENISVDEIGLMGLLGEQMQSEFSGIWDDTTGGSE